jgi:hypothetical protein
MSAEAEVKETIEKAARFVRKYRHYPLTQDPVETREMFFGLIEPTVSAAARCVLNSPYMSGYCVTNAEQHAYAYGGVSVTAYLYPGNVPGTHFPNLQGTRDPGYLDPERKAKFDAWFPVAVERVKAGDRALRVLADLKDIANTPGQLLRMVPGLQQLFVKDALARVNEQTRRSQLPREWAPHDKSGIPEMLDCMTMGMLVTGHRLSHAWGDAEWVGDEQSVKRGYFLSAVQ